VYPTNCTLTLRPYRRRTGATKQLTTACCARPQSGPSKPPDPRRDAAYRRLAVAVLGLDISTLTGALRSAHH
jgi:hypothetical protein